MSTLSFLLGGVSAIGFLALIIYWAARNSGRSEALAEMAKRDAENAREAGQILAEHRTVDDTIDKLSNGKF